MRFMPISPRPPRGMMRRGSIRAAYVSRWSADLRSAVAGAPIRRPQRGPLRRLRVNAVQHARVRNGLAEMRHAADPGHYALDAHAEPRVREGSVFAHVEVPLELVERQA